MAITVLQEKESHNISVYVRVRPLNPSALPADWDFKERSIVHTRNGCKKDYVLDNVFCETASTDEVYQQTTQPLVKTVLDGFSCTVFAYGQTNSGKTFTMRGTSSDDGIVGRAVTDLFEKLKQHTDKQFCLRASYMEIYNEEVNDLLNPEKRNLSVKMDQDNGILVAGLSEVLVYSKEDVMRLLRAGDAKRHIGETKMNDKSSRSHSIFKMVVESTPIECDENRENCSAVDPASFAVKIGVLNLVDLAGSERVTKTGAEGSRLKEGVNINKSLLTLGLVIKNLSEGASKAGRHIPYRDSKLTRILEPSLGGNAKTVIICMMTPEAAHVDEGHNTLEFATRAKKVVNEVAAVETMTSAALLKRQANEIEKLKAQLCQDGSENVAQEIQELQQKMLDMEKAMEIQAASMDIVTKQKVFYEKRNMDLMAANKRAAQKRSRVRRETIAHFGPPVDDAEDVGSPCSGATRDSEMSVDAGLSADAPIDPMLATGTGPAPLPAIGEDQEVAEGVEEFEDDGGRKKKHSRGSFDQTGAVNGGQDQRRSAGAGLAGQRQQRSEAAVEPFAEELRGCVRDLKAQLAERDTSLAAASEQLATLRAEMEVVNSELAKVRFALQRSQYERRSQAASEEKAAEESDALRKQLEVAVAEAGELRANLQRVQSVLAEALEKRDADGRDAAARLREAEDARTAAERAVEKAEVDVKLHQERDRRRLEELETLAAEARTLREEREEAIRGATQAGEGSARVTQELQDAQEEIERLKSHVSDLESRKRPPLYQRKQEEELKAASEHAAECEARTATAEAALKVSQEELAVLTDDLAVLQAEMDRAAARHVEQVDEWRVKWEFDVNEAKTTAAKTEAALQEQLEDIQAKNEVYAETLVEAEEKQSRTEEAAQAKAAELEAELEKRTVELQAERDTSREWEEALAHQNVNVDRLVDEVAAHERDVEALKAQAEAMQAAHREEKESIAAAHAAAMTESAAQHKAAVEQLSSDVAKAKEQHEEELTAAKKEHADAQQAALEEHAAALAAKDEEVARLAVHGRKLQDKLDESPAAFKALAELKELRVKYKQDTASLNSQLKTANMSSKGGDKAKQLLQREFEKLQKKQGETDTKLRNAASEKQQLASEKLALDRKVKQLEMQVAKASKEVDKKEQAASKKLEAAQEALTKAKEDFAKLEAKYINARDDNVKGIAAYGVLESRFSTLEEQYEESQRLFKEAETQLREMQQEVMDIENENDELKLSLEEATAKSTAEAAQLADVTAQLQAAHEAGAVAAEREECLAARVQELLVSWQAAQDSGQAEAALRADAEAASADARKALAEVQQEAEALQRSLDSERQGSGAAAREHSAAMHELRNQLQEQVREIGELRQALTERRESLTQRVAEVSTLSAERDAVLLEVQEAHSRAEDAEAELQLVQERLADATQAVAERNAELQARKTVMDAHEREFRTLQQELERVKVQVSAQKSSQSEQVRNAERARAEAVAELREVREELHAAKSKASDESSAARESAVAKDAALREAQSVGSRAQAALDDLTAEAAKLRAQVKALSEEVQTLRKQLEDAKAREAAVKNREGIAMRQVAEVNESITDHIKTNEALQEMLARSEEERRRVTSELDRARRSAGGALLQEARSAPGAPAVEERRLQETVAALEAELAEMRERWGAVTAELQRRETGAQQASATAAAMREGAVAAEERCEQLEAEMAAREQAIADLKEASVARTSELEEVQAKLEKTLRDSTLWKETYLMQKQWGRKLECIQDRMRKMLHTQHGLPEEEFTKLAEWLSEEYDRLFVRRQEKKKQKAAEQGQQVDQRQASDRRG